MQDNVKQKLLYELSKESTMVLSTAYVYAKNYVKYGIDITKAWSTAVEQVSILDNVRLQAYESFKKDYQQHIKLTNSDWIDFLVEQFDISRTSAKSMLHGMMSIKRIDNFKKQFSGRDCTHGKIGGV